HPTENISDFNFSDSDYGRFKTFVKSHGFSYETNTEKALKKIMQNEEINEFGPQIKADYQTLLDDIENVKLSSLDQFKQSIQKNIEDELIVRYFYRDGLYDYYLKNDQAITEATAVLKDNAKYQQVLN